MKKQVIDLSPKILKMVSILSIVLIIATMAMDIILSDSIHYGVVIPLIMLYVFCRYFSKEHINNSDN